MRVGVVIPTYGRRDLLARCVESLAAADPAPAIAVIVDGNDEPVPLPAGLPGWMQRVREANRGPAHARNVGYRLCRDAGVDVVCFLDDDATAPPDWVARHATLHEQHPRAGIVGGGIENLYAGSVIAEYVHRVVFRPLRDDPGPVRMVPSVNISYKVACFDAVGPFDTGLTLAGGEDVEHCWRVRAAGWDVHYEPSLVVGHHYPTTWRSVVRQQRAYGRGFAQSRMRHPDLPGADLLDMPWWRAVAGTAPHVVREAMRTEHEVARRAVPVSVVREMTFRAAALAERRRTARRPADAEVPA